jgi:glucose-6-phosphate isomerase
MKRSVNDLKKVLFDQSWAKKAPNFNVYQVWRGLKSRGHLRYDETVIFPKMLGAEFPKTKGHEHPPECRELLLVLKGEAIFLLQKDEGNQIEDVYFVRAKKGQAALSPSGYSHVAINPLKKDLKIATWMDKRCESDYRNIEKLGGFGYYYTVSGWQKNKNYKRIPKLKEKKPLKKAPRRLDFLNCFGCY